MSSTTKCFEGFYDLGNKFFSMAESVPASASVKVHIKSLGIVRAMSKT
jgi:hypothetical protein